MPGWVDAVHVEMGAVTEGEETAKDAITALDLLGTLLPWRTVVLASGAFPRFHDQPDKPWKGSGNPEMWIKVGHVEHMTCGGASCWPAVSEPGAGVARRICEDRVRGSAREMPVWSAVAGRGERRVCGGGWMRYRLRGYVGQRPEADGTVGAALRGE
ncbi:hypothetical protein [Streptomyces sp. TRM70350]|uniref:hypothetical protein n=1 Tax=Streptomyces sp. TRM70350 TaxID=2856165 RepID=UPI001C48FEE3|nr:hypothetical protein [Streptomyces sp. TRM70350]MBV7695005.1 hypothetical protein [Streptomyces sp. TRM70350]